MVDQIKELIDKSDASHKAGKLSTEKATKPIVPSAKYYSKAKYTEVKGLSKNSEQVTVLISVCT